MCTSLSLAVYFTTTTHYITAASPASSRQWLSSAPITLTLFLFQCFNNAAIHTICVKGGLFARAHM